MTQWSHLAVFAVLSRWLATGPLPVAGDVIINSDTDKYTKLAEESQGFPHQTFKSSPIVAPIFLVNSWDKSLTDDSLYLFLGGTYRKVGGGGGPMIFDSDLNLIYADQNYEDSYNSEMSTTHGEPYLTFWADNNCFVLDQTYNIKYKVNAHDGMYQGMHELQITDQGTAVTTSWRMIPYDCSVWGGNKTCKIQDTGFEEIDLETNNVLFKWSAADHFDPKDTYARYLPGEFGLNSQKEGYFDFSHINAARKVGQPSKKPARTQKRIMSHWFSHIS
jgi:hypothetical protein